MPKSQVKAKAASLEDSIKRDKLFYAEDGEFPTTCGELNYLLTRIIHEYIKENGYELTGRHHEIYLGDPRRSAPEKLKTIIRQPMRKR